MSFKIGVVKNFAIFTEKPVSESLFNKVEDPEGQQLYAFL